MTKNVNVVDDLGNRYVPTYAKRAKGLVKNGRARWVDENTICLACPPDDMNLEDTNMENKINPIESMTLMDILDRMDKIIAQGDALAEVVRQIKDLPVNESLEGGQDGANRAMAIGDIYRAREATNQKMLAMLDKMYDDMMGKQATASEADKVIEAISKINFAGISHQTAAIIMDHLMGK